MYELAVCAETVFQSLPFPLRILEIAKSGFFAEFWGRTGSDIDAIERAIQSDPRVCISSIIGFTHGSMMHPLHVDAFLEGVNARIAISKRVGCRRLVLLTSELDAHGASRYPVFDHRALAWTTAYETLSRVADVAEQHDVFYNLENLNTKIDHPGYPLSHVEDCVNLVEKVGSRRIRILLDVYHEQTEGGNPIQDIVDYHDFIGYVHVADVPGRHEPGTGEMDYPAIAQALQKTDYQGIIGLEAFPFASDHEALNKFREIFSPGV